MAKKMIIKGVGTIMARRAVACPGDVGTKEEIITLGSLQNLKIDMAVETEDIFGGDGVFAIDTLVKSKSIEITATDAKFDLAGVSLMMGDAVQDNVADYVWELNEGKKVGSGGIVTLNYKVFDASAVEDIQVRQVKDGKAIPASDISVDNTGATAVLTIDNITDGEQVYVNYKRPETVSMVEIMRDSFPFTVSIVHHGVFSQKCGKKMGIETELFACKAKGNFTIDAQRNTASASTVTLQMLDPELPCGKIGTIKVFEVDDITCVS